MMIRRIVALTVVVVVLGAGVVGALRMIGSDTKRTATTTSSTETSPDKPVPKPPKKPRLLLSKEAKMNATLDRYIALGLPIYRAGGRGKYIALTFDDGPGLRTPDLLDKLQAHRFRATFFLLGWSVASREEIVLRETRFGSLGNHSWNHADLARLPRGQVRTQLRDTKGVIARASGQPVRLFRPPFGSRNRMVDAEAKRAGLLTVMWSVDTRDALGASSEQILTSLKQGTRPGAIILMHEHKENTQTALTYYLPWLKSQGYKVVTIPELLLYDPPSVAQVRRDARVFGGVVEKKR